MPTIDTIRRLTVQGQSVGLDKLNADLKAVAKGHEQVAQSSAKLVSATTSSERSVLSAQGALDRYTKALDPLTRATANLERGERALAAVRAQGGTVTDANARALANAKARVDELRESVDKHGKATGLNNMQQLETVHVLKSVADQIIAGQSPMRALAVEGGRIGQIFASGSGGVGGTLKSLGGTVASLATGWVGLGIATAGAAALGVVALTSYTDQQHKLAEALQGTGRAAGLTVDQLDAVAKASARGTNLSGGNAQNLAATYAHAGFSGAVTGSLIGVTPNFARATGQSTEDAGKALADALADPTSGFASLDKAVGSLDDQLRSTIKGYQDSGSLDAARRALTEGLNRSLADTVDHSTRLSHALEGAEHSIGGFISGLGGYLARQINGPSLDEQIKTLQTRLGSQTDPGGRVSGQFNRQQIDQRAELARLLAQRDAEAKTTTDAAARANAARVSQQAGDAVRAILPEIAQAQTATSQITLLRTALANPQILGAMGVTRGQTTQALGNLTVQQANADPFVRMTQDAKLALDAINATSLAERAAVEARRAELAVLRETGDVTRAAAASQNALNEQVAKARSDAEDRFETSKQNLALVGLSPYERGLQEIRNKYEGSGGIFDKDSATRSELTEALRPVESDLRSAGQMIVNALHGVANGISGAIPGSTPTLASGAFQAGSPTAAQQQVLKALVGAGYNPAASAGFVGGLTGESGPGLSTTAVNSTSGAFGMMQALGARKSALQTMFDPTSLSTQTSFILSELTGPESAAGRMLKNATTVQGGLAANLAYERPSKKEIGDSYGSRLAAGQALAGDSPVASTVQVDAAATLSADKGAFFNDKAAYNQEQLQGPLKAANQALQQQIDLFNVQKSTAGQSAAQIQAAAEAERLFSAYTAADPNHKMGADAWKTISDGVDAYRTKLGETLQAQADFQAQQQKTITTLDGIRSTSGSALSGFLNDVKNGQTAGKAFDNVLSGIEGKLLNFASDQVINSLFGKTGTANGGALGGGFASIINSLFGSPSGGGGSGGIGHMATGSDNWRGGLSWVGEKGPEIVNVPRGAQVISNADLSAARAQRTATQAAAAMPGGANGSAPYEIHMHNAPAGTDVADVKTTRGTDGRQSVHVMFRMAALHDVQTNGPMTQALQKRFGVNRTGG